jgi:hypothetical protein
MEKAVQKEMLLVGRNRSVIQKTELISILFSARLNTAI